MDGWIKIVLTHAFLWGRVMGNVHIFSFPINIFLHPTHCLYAEKDLNVIRGKKKTTQEQINCGYCWSTRSQYY